MVDDGEKFGAWPGTHARVYEEGWLDRFFDRLLATPWLEATTLGDVVERTPASGRVYLPAASYGEMGEWALPTDAARALEAAKAEVSRLPDGERLAGLFRSGFWRSFLVKYPEVGDAHWKMLRLSRAIHGALAQRPDDARLIRLWREKRGEVEHLIFGEVHVRHAQGFSLALHHPFVIDVGLGEFVLEETFVVVPGFVRRTVGQARQIFLDFDRLRFFSAAL